MVESLLTHLRRGEEYRFFQFLTNPSGSYGGDTVSTEAVASRRHAVGQPPTIGWKLELPTRAGTNLTRGRRAITTTNTASEHEFCVRGRYQLLPSNPLTVRYY
jgi:hypothetical protein